MDAKDEERMHGRSTKAVLSSVALVLFALLWLGSSAGRAAAADSFEPNDKPGQATPLPSGSTLESWISSASDVDWYTFTSVGAGQISIAVTSVPAEPADYDLVLFELNGQELNEIGRSAAGPGVDEGLEGTSNGGTIVLYAAIFAFKGTPGNPNDSYLVSATYPGQPQNQPPTVTLNSPNGGETYVAGSQHAITWTASDPDAGPQALSIALEYSTNAGTNWNQIVTQAAASGTFNWTVPNVTTTQARVRATVSDGAATATDQSNANFSIQPAPTGDNVLAIGSANGQSGSTVSVSLTLDNDNGVKALQTRIGFDPAVVTFESATVTGRGTGMSISTQVQGGNQLQFLQFFTDANVISPGTGAIATLTFRCVGQGGTQSALTQSETILSDANAQALPSTTTNGSISVQGGGGGENIVSLGQVSGASGTPVQVPLNLTNPTSTVKGLQTDIAFTPGVATFASSALTARANGASISTSVLGGNTLRVLVFFTDANVIATGTGAIANLTFNLVGANGSSTNLTPSATILSDASGGSLSVQNQAGSINVTGGGGGNTPPTVTVTSPNGGESVNAGASQTVTWTATDAETPANQLTVSIALSTNGGGSFSTLATGEANDGSFTYTVPTPATTQARIRVTVRDGGSLEASDTSNANFTIVSNPGGGNRLSVGNGQGANGADVAVALNLANEDVVKALQTDIAFDPAVVGFVSAAAGPRANGASVSTSVLGGNTLRVLVFYTDATTIPAGSGAVANLTFHLIGSAGQQSALTPGSTVLSDPASQPLEVTNEAGSIQVQQGGGGSLDLNLFALKNPGRTRSFQVFLRASAALSSNPTVTVNGAAVSMTEVDPTEHLYRGDVHVARNLNSATVQANASGGGQSGTATLTVTF